MAAGSITPGTFGTFAIRGAEQSAISETYAEALKAAAEEAVEKHRLREIVRQGMLRRAMTPPPIPSGGFPPLAQPPPIPAGGFPPIEPPPVPSTVAQGLGRYTGELPLVDRSEAARRALAEATSKSAKTAEQFLKRGSSKGLELVKRMGGESLKDAYLRSRASEITRGAVDAMKAAAGEAGAAETAVTEAAATTQNVGKLARAIGAGKRSIDLLRSVNNFGKAGGRIMPRLVRGVSLPALAGAAAIGAAANIAGSMAVHDAQDDAVNLLNEIGFNVERPGLGWRDLTRWYWPSEGKGFIETALSGEGDPNVMIPASDINQIRVFDPEGEVGTAGSMEDEIDLLRRHNVHQKLMARLQRLNPNSRKSDALLALEDDLRRAK